DSNGFDPGPDDPARTGPFSLPVGLLVALVAIAAVELGFESRSEEFTEPCSFIWRMSWRQEVERAPGQEVLCFGDSRAKHALLPRVIQQWTGMQCYNLAVSAAPPVLTEMMFRRALDRGARPRVIVVDFKPSLLARPPEIAMRLWQEVPGLDGIL